MKNQILIGGTILMLAAMSAWGAENVSSDQGLQYDQGDSYRANELSLDAFGTASLGRYTIENWSASRARHNGQLGAGLGLNYFFIRNLGIGAEIAGSVVPLPVISGSAISWSAIAGGLAGAVGAWVAGKLSPELSLVLASASVNWSRRSDSILPFEVSNWYPERDGIESAYHAVTFVLTRTTDPPDAVEFTCTADW